LRAHLDISATIQNSNTVAVILYSRQSIKSLVT
jgi:hypothetical protein